MGFNSPLNCRDDDQRLQSVAAGICAGTGLRNQCGQCNPTTQPEAHGYDLNEGNYIFVRDAREPERGETEVGHCDDGSPAAVEEHEVVDI